MSHAHGWNSFFGWAEEVTFRTGVTTPAKFLECESIAVSDDRKVIHKPLLGHVSRRRVVNDKHSGGITIKAPMPWEGAEQLLEHAIGSVGTAGPSGGYYTHTFTPAAALPVGLTCYVDVDEGAIGGNHAQSLAGSQIDKLTLTQEMGGTLDMEVEFVGSEFTDVARTSPSLPTYDAIDYAMMTLATVNPAGTNIEIPLRKFKLEINNNLFKEQYRLTGAGKRAGFGRAGQRTVMMEFEVEYESDSYTNYYKSLTNTDLRFKWVSGSRELTITTPAGYFAGSRPGAGDGGPVYVTMPFDALTSGADNAELSLVLVNTVVSV